MTQKRKYYSKQFKIDTVKLVTEQGYKVSEAARNLEIHHSSLRRWEKQYKANCKGMVFHFSFFTLSFKFSVLIHCQTSVINMPHRIII